MTREERTLVDGMVAELASVLGTMVGSTVTMRQAGGGAGAGWTVSCALRGARQGVIEVSFERGSAVRLAALVLAMEGEDPSDADVSDTLKEIVNQAAGALTLKPAGSGLSFDVNAAVPGAPVEDMAAWFELPINDALIVRVAGNAALTAGAVVAAAAVGSAAGGDRSRGNANGGAQKVPDNLDVILDIDLPLSVRFGRAELTIDALSKLGPGSLIELVRSPDDPVDLLVNGKLVARGEVVVVGGNYGVRVHEVVSAAERIRSLE